MKDDASAKRAQPELATLSIWNMTRIAASQSPRALDLFRDVMIASAAIPGAFPPVMIDVELEGKRFQEMHVDGGATAQVFVYPTIEFGAMLGCQFQPAGTGGCRIQTLKDTPQCRRNPLYWLLSLS